MPLTQNNLKSELSYGVLHAVAARARFGCEIGGRHSDDLGIDARIVVQDYFGEDAPLTNFTLDIQLKATSQQLSFDGERFSFRLTTAHYDKLRSESVVAPRYLVVLLLPENAAEWLELTSEQLICRRCLYWVSLLGAPEVSTQNISVYLPDSQILTPDALRELAACRAREEWLYYE